MWPEAGRIIGWAIYPDCIVIRTQCPCGRSLVHDLDHEHTEINWLCDCGRSNKTMMRLFFSWAWELVDGRMMKEVEQALTDPENQPNQFGIEVPHG